MKTTNRILFSIIFVLALTACGKPIQSPTAAGGVAPVVSPLGLFSSSACFKNKLASQGFGQDVFTRASMEFRGDGTGTSHYELYTDQDCTTDPLVGSTETTYTYTNSFGDVSVLQIDQLNDPNDPNSSMRYWLLVILNQNGYIIDINDVNGTAGPFLVEPGEADALAFRDEVNGRGVFFQRQ